MKGGKMFKLLKKEIALGYMPIVWFFPLLSALILLPNYPYCVAVSYCVLNIFITFNYAGENRDTEYSASLPVPRRDIVKAKVLSGFFLELMQISVAVICGLISAFVLSVENFVGLDANFTFFGLFLLNLAVLNFTFFPLYFARGCKTGLAILTSVLIYVIMVVIEELLIGIVPVLHEIFDGFSPEYIGARAAVFCVGLIGYIASAFGSYFISVEKFKKVSL